MDGQYSAQHRIKEMKRWQYCFLFDLQQSFMVLWNRRSKILNITTRVGEKKSCDSDSESWNFNTLVVWRTNSEWFATYLCLSETCLLLTLSSTESLRCSSRAMFSASATWFTVRRHETFSCVADMICLRVAQRCHNMARNCRIRVTPGNTGILLDEG